MTGRHHRERRCEFAELAMERCLRGSGLVPSFLHEILVELFRNRADLVRELLHSYAGLELGEVTAETASVDLSQVASTEYRADNVTVFRDKHRVPTLAVVIEIQRWIDVSKLWTWPVYLTAARASFRCPTMLLVIAPDPRVAQWARSAIETGHPGFHLKPIVVSFADVPLVVDPAVAQRNPELGVLSVLAHPTVETAEAALAGIALLDPDLSKLYFDVILAALPELARTTLEAHMERYEYQSEFARRYVAQGLEQGLERGLEQGLERGLEQGLERGLEQGLERGLEQGLERGRQDAAIELARVKLGQMSPEDEAAIHAIHDAAALTALIVGLGKAQDEAQARAAIMQAIVRRP
jgi:hypothetical protein